MLVRALEDSRASTVTLKVGSERRDFRRTLPREPPPCGGLVCGFYVLMGEGTDSDEDDVFVAV
jgi:hypothetical protein